MILWLKKFLRKWKTWTKWTPPAAISCLKTIRFWHCSPVATFMPVSFRPSAIFAWPEFFVDVKFKLLKKINFCLENDFLSSKVIVVEKIWFFYLKNNFWLEIEFLSLVMNFQAKSRFIFHKPIFDFGIHFDSKFDFWPEFFVDWPKISSSLVGSSIHRGLNSLSAETRSIASFERVFYLVQF